MRRSLLVFLLVLGACQQQQSKAPQAAVQLAYEGADYHTAAERIAHGERLTHVLGCRGCHGENFQGRDMAAKPDDGAMYSPNVTRLAPGYSPAEFERFFRDGVPKDGHRFWFMQVESYQFLSDADLDALIAYLKTLSPAGEVRPPFRINAAEQKDVDTGVLLDSTGQIAKFRKDPPVDLGPGHAWGRYMVQTTCTGCHNNALQGWPNFTPDLDIGGAYSKAELTQLLTSGKGKNGKDVGEMSGIARAYFSHLTPREREAIVDYVLARANRPH